MIKLKLLPPEDIKKKALWFQKFRNECKAYLAKHGINLPSSVTLSYADIERICTIIKKYAV